MKIFAKFVPPAEKKCIFIGRGYDHALFRFIAAFYFGIRLPDLDVPDILVNLQDRGWNLSRKTEKENGRVWLVGRRGYKNNRRQTVLQTISSKKNERGVYGYHV